MTGLCEYEGCDRPAADLHHRDGNPLNNERTNIMALCRRHHMELDGRLDALRERNRKGSKQW